MRAASTWARRYGAKSGGADGLAPTPDPGWERSSAITRGLKVSPAVIRWIVPSLTPSARARALRIWRKPWNRASVVASAPGASPATDAETAASAGFCACAAAGVSELAISPVATHSATAHDRPAPDRLARGGEPRTITPGFVRVIMSASLPYRAAKRNGAPPALPRAFYGRFGQATVGVACHPVP